MNQLFDNKFFYRLRFFVLGVLIGTVVLWVIYWKDNRKNVYKWPSEIILDNLNKGHWQLNEKSKCLIKQANTNITTLKAILLNENTTINFSKSNVNQKPTKTYCVECLINNQQSSVLFTLTNDTIVNISKIIINEKNIICP
jgi:hypothetical protein